MVFSRPWKTGRFPRSLQGRIHGVRENTIPSWPFRTSALRAPAPLLTRLPPELAHFVLERRRQLRWPKVTRAELARDALRSNVARRDHVHDLGPAEVLERPVDGRRCTFGGVTAAPALARNAPADFGSRPAF